MLVPAARMRAFAQFLSSVPYAPTWTQFSLHEIADPIDGIEGGNVRHARRAYAHGLSACIHTNIATTRFAGARARCDAPRVRLGQGMEPPMLAGRTPREPVRAVNSQPALRDARA